MLTKYEQQKIEMTPKEFNAKDYFENKKNKVEADILSVRKKIVMNKYPTWGRCFNNLGREQLKGFIDIVDLKIQACNQRIIMLKSMQQCDQKSFIQNTSQIQIVPPEDVASPQSSQPMKPLIDISELKDFTDLIEWDDPTPQKNVFSSQSSQPMKPLIDISELKDFTDLIEWDNPMPQKNVFSSQSSQPMKPLIDISELKDFTDLIEWDNPMPQKNVFSSQSSQLDVTDNIPQMQHVPAPLKSIDNISDMIDYTDLIDLDYLMPQKNIFSSQSSQLDVMHNILQIQHVPAPLKSFDNISLPQVSSTCQLGEFGKLDDLVHNQLNDGDCWVKQPDVFEGKDISFLSEIEQQCAALDAFFQPRYGF
ncbi:hypothetical protein TSUD_155010 [Trifolium subterraneum]|uniref:MADS-box domain-containing protein n=1 Tax=Trifolium subterraneum TaxID=3900 RepID=A0A2Z6N727_TRISU|nr:hypothetical protein TSUD_155010 [Trifolium subterraneum]